MALKKNVIYIYFKGKHLVTSKSQYQYNHGQFLYFADLDLPQTFEVHFSNTDEGYAKPQIGSNRLVEIPDVYFWTKSSQIYAWIYLHEGTTDGETKYEVIINLERRSEPVYEEILPTQQTTIERAIAELNNAVDVTTENANKTGEDRIQVSNIKDEIVDLKEDIDANAELATEKAQEAINASLRSEASAQNAAEYESNAHDYSDEAKDYAQQALESKTIASQKATIATDASVETLGYRDETLVAKNDVLNLKQNVIDYKNETKGYLDETKMVRADVQNIDTEVKDYALQAQASATSASQSATVSANSASASAQSASEAQTASTNAETYALNSGNKAVESAQSAQASANSASQAREYANNASASAQSASGYASSAQTSANTASAKAQDASQSASTASEKASESAQSASLALGYKNDALQAKTDAETAQTSAEQARDDAQTAQTLAENAESNAESTVHGVLDSLDLETTSGSIVETHDAFPVSPEKMVVDINPVQNLNGYDHPWVGGGGKNKIPFPYVSNSGTVDGITYTIGDDGKITATGTTERGTNFFFVRNTTLTAGTYTVSVIGDFAGLTLMIYDSVNKVTVCNILPADSMHYKTFTIESDKIVNIYLNTGQTGVTVNISAYFQLEQGSTATSYAPYENICPISGWTEANIPQTGKNLCSIGEYTIPLNTKRNEIWSGNLTGTFTVTIDKSGITSVEIPASSRFCGVMVDGNTVWIPYTQDSMTVTGNITQIVVYGSDAYAKAVGTIKVQLEIGDTATEYELYKGRIINVNWEDEVGTVYGGTLDMVDWVLRVNRKILTVDAISTVASSYIHSDGIDGYLIDSNIQPRLNPLLQSIQYCNKLKFQAKAIWTGGVSEPNVFAINQNQIHIKISNDLLGITDYTQETTTTAKEKLNTWLAENPVTLTIPIEPIEIQLTPQQITLFKDYNALWADTGDISEFAYRAGEFATKAEIPEVPVEDVQVNGTSVVENKVANIDLSGIEQNAEDIASLEEDIYKPYAVDTASGAIASFPDGADDIPLKSLIVDINPVQDLHGYDSPWVADGGKNKINAPDVTLSSGSYLYNGALALPVGTYTISFASSSGASTSASLSITDADGTAMVTGGHVIPYTFTLPNASAFVKIYVSGAGTYTNIQIEEGSSATVYAPYENLCPISGWMGCEVNATGINIWDEEWEVGGIKTSDGSTTTGNAVRSKNFCQIVPNTTYYAHISSSYLYAFFYDDDKNYVGYSQKGNDTFTTPTNARYFKIQATTRYGTTYNHDISINYPSTDHDYHPYTGQTIPINWQTEAGTVYGGKLDVLNGVMRVDRQYIDMGDLNWNYITTSDRNFFLASIPERKPKSALLCSAYTYMGNSNDSGMATREDKTLWGDSSATSHAFKIKDSAYTDKTAFKEAMSGVDLVYELEVPIEILLEPTEVKSLYGQNNIFAGTGNTACEYRADIKLYIEKLTQPTEDDMVANSAITSGQFFMVGNSLYLALTAIASGATITVGTNAQRVSLADALNLINT